MVNSIHMNKFTLKHYFNDAIASEDFHIAIDHAECITDEGILIPPLAGYEFACYINYKEKAVIDHKYYQFINIIFEPNLEIVSFEIFARKNTGGRPWRIIGRPVERFITLENGTTIPYKLTEGQSKDLVIYFDYSRLVSKVLLHEEYCPSFGFKTDKNVLVLSNNFGYWGTASLFDSNGRFIVPGILKFINKTIEEMGCERVFLVGASQGGVSALVYGSLIEKCTEIFSCVPMPINKKVMLKHMSHTINSDDIWFSSKLLTDCLSRRNVNLYSTVGDPIWEYHKELAEIGRDNIRFALCQDPNVGHEKCLKYFIKEIYQRIESL